MISWPKLLTEDTGSILDWLQEQGFKVTLKLDRLDNKWTCRSTSSTSHGFGTYDYFATEATDEHSRTAVLKVLNVCYSAVYSGVTIRSK